MVSCKFSILHILLKTRKMVLKGIMISEVTKKNFFFVIAKAFDKLSLLK